MKGKFISLDEMVHKLTQDRVNRFTTWVDKVTFMHIFVVWVVVISSFGVFYFLVSTETMYLLDTLSHAPVQGILDHIYFSFVTATTTGFGDIIPVGYFKIVAIAEVTFGFMLLAFVTSKLVSLKQNVLLDEMYDISFQERINSVRSSFLLFRQHMMKLIEKVEAKMFSVTDISDLYNNLSSLEDTLLRAKALLKNDNNSFTKDISLQQVELIFNSMVQSFEKLKELLILLGFGGHKWKQDLSVTLLKRCVQLNHSFFEKSKVFKELPRKIRADLKQKNMLILSSIEEEIK